VSIVRVGLSDTKGFAEGYEAIFGKKKAKEAPAKKAKPVAKSAAKNAAKKGSGKQKKKAVKKKSTTA
jgi:hypothetical protein